MKVLAFRLLLYDRLFLMLMAKKKPQPNPHVDFFFLFCALEVALLPLMHFIINILWLQ